MLILRPFHAPRKDKIAQGQNVPVQSKGEGFRSDVTGCVQTQRSSDQRQLARQPVLPAFAACPRTKSSNTSVKVDLDPLLAGPHRASLDPNPGNRKEDAGRVRQKEAALP